MVTCHEVAVVSLPEVECATTSPKPAAAVIGMATEV